MKFNQTNLGNYIYQFALATLLTFCAAPLFGQVHIEPPAPRICLGDSVLLRVVADNPGNIPTFFAWVPIDSLSNPSNDSTYAYPTDTITYFVETNAGGASVTVYVIPPPPISFTSLAPNYFCANEPPIPLTGTPSGGVFFTDAPSGLVGNTFVPAVATTGAPYNIYYALTYGDTSMCMDTVSQNFIVSPLPNAAFSGLAATYCSNDGIVTLNPAEPGGTFSSTIPGGALSGNEIDLSLVPTGVNYNVTYTLTQGDPPCSSSTTSGFIVNTSPFVVISGIPGGTLCSDMPPITVTGTPAGGTFSFDAPSGLVGNILTPANVPFGTNYTLTYTYTNSSGCTGTATRNITVLEKPTASFTGLAPSYCEASGIVTLVGNPSGGFFFTDIPGITFSGDVVDLDLSLVPIGTSYNITYYYSAGGDPPCSDSQTQSFIINASPAVSFSGLPGGNLCSGSAPVTLTGSPAGGTFFTTAPSGLSGNILTPANIPAGITYTVGYTYVAGNGCAGTATESIYVIASPTVSFSGLSPTYCGASGTITLTGSPAGGFFETDIPGITFSGDIVTLDLSLVPVETTYTITYNYYLSSDPPCNAASAQNFIIKEAPFANFSGLPGGTLCTSIPPITLTGTPAGGTFFTTAPTGLSGNILTPAQVPTGSPFTLSYAFTAANGCADTATQNILVLQEPTVGFSGLSSVYCEPSGIVTLTGSPSGGFFNTDIPGISFSGDIVDLDLSLVPVGVTYHISYYFSAGGDPPCSATETRSFIIQPPAPVSFSGLPATICANTPPITLTGNPAGGTFSTIAPSGLTGNILTPANVPPGNEYSLTYTYVDVNGCPSSSNQSFFVNALSVVDAGTYGPVCINAAPITLSGTPAGGTFSGTGVTGNTFNPAVGTQTITYTFTNANGCTSTNQTTITVNPLPVVNAGTYGPVCINAAPITLSGTPAGGTFSGTGVTGNTFNPAVGTQTITYTFTNANGCTNSSQTTIIVNPLPVVSAGTYGPVCINAAPITLSGTPAGGTFSGTGVTGNLFNPAVGTQTITYTFTNANGCTNSSQTTITVNPLTAVSAGTYGPVCINAAPITLSGTPAGGTFSGTGVSGNLFNPAVGTQTITYTYTNANGCTSTNQTTIIVTPLTAVNAGTYGPVCINAAPITLSGTPVGGTFSGTGVSGNLFNPAVGTQTITYTYTNANGCTSTGQTTITVNPLTAVNAGTYGPVCINDAPVTLSGTPVGGTFSGTGVSGNLFNPAVGTQTITYTYTNINGCTSTNQTTIIVNPLTAVNAGTYGPVCINAPAVTLSGTPAGGTFSGTGVSGNLFNPAVGTQTITYTYTNINGCTSTNQTTITVNPLTAVNAGTYGPVCINAAPVTLSGTPAGGTFSGTGVSGNLFNPAVGTQTITYTYTNANGCTSTGQTTITVNPLTAVNAGTYGPVCINAAPITLSGTPAGGTFSGTGVTGNTFNPAAGTQTITYTYTNANGCTSTGQTTITVNPLPAVNAGTYGPLCSNDSPITLTGTPVGGNFNGTGVSGNTFNPNAGTQTITYTYTDITGCTNSDQTIIVVKNAPVVNAGTYPAICINSNNLILTGNPSGGIFSGIGVTGNQFNPSVGTQTITYTYTNMDGCTGTDETVITVNTLQATSAGSYPAVCQNAPDIVLTGTPAGGTFTGTGVSGNTFDPSAGTQTITYTITINGCINAAQTIIPVNAIPTVNAGVYTPVCADAPPLTLSGTPSGGLFSGNGVTGSLFNPSAGTQTVTYTFTDNNGCTNTGSAGIIVHPLPVADAGTYANTCQNGTDIPLTGTPEGGIFSGNGVTGNLFDPSVGTTTITYTYTDGNGCTNTDQALIQVDPILMVNFSGLSPAYCANDGLVTLSGIPAGGSFTTDAPSGLDGSILSPSLIPTGIPYNITYTFTDANGCTGTATQTFKVNPLPVVQFNGLSASYCVDALPVTLSGTPLGGIFSTNAPAGLSGNTLTPALVPTGTFYNIDYQYTDGNGCMATTQQSFVVNPLPVVNAGTYTPVCIDAQPVQLSGTPTGGIFSGAGVTNAVFNPANGTQTISYTYSDMNGCTNTGTAQITVNLLPVVSLSGLAAQYCNNTANVVLTGSPAGGTFTSDIPAALINGNTFVPAFSGNGGTVNITYTYQNAAGCVAATSVSTEVRSAPTVNLSDTLVLCGQSGTVAVQPVAPNQTYQWSNGQTTASISVSADDTYTVTVTAGNGCTASDSSDVFIQSGQQFISNLLVSNTACTGDTLHFFDISEILTGVDSYFWQFGDGMASTDRDPVHIYTSPGIFNVTLTATSQECQNISLAKQVQIQTCKKGAQGDIFDHIVAYPNPAAGNFRVDISLNEPKDVLVTLKDMNGKQITSQLLTAQPWYQVQYRDLAPGVYFVHIQGETKAVVLKVLIF